jgi:hypothetical protein
VTNSINLLLHAALIGCRGLGRDFRAHTRSDLGLYGHEDGQYTRFTPSRTILRHSARFNIFGRVNQLWVELKACKES